MIPSGVEIFVSLTAIDLPGDLIAWPGWSKSSSVEVRVAVRSSCFSASDAAL